jgi:hypothetical protein
LRWKHGEIRNATCASLKNCNRRITNRRGEKEKCRTTISSTSVEYLHQPQLWYSCPGRL